MTHPHLTPSAHDTPALAYAWLLPLVHTARAEHAVATTPDAADACYDRVLAHVRALVWAQRHARARHGERISLYDPDWPHRVVERLLTVPHATTVTALVRALYDVTVPVP